MDQYPNKRPNQFLYNLIAYPANQGQEYMNDLQQLVKNFPQSGILQALLAHANGSATTIRQAAAYFDPASLYKIVKAPAGLPVIEPGQVFYQSDTIGGKYNPRLAPQQPEPVELATDDTETVFTEVIEETAIVSENIATDNTPVENFAEPVDGEEITAAEETALVEELPVTESTDETPSAIPDGDLQASEEVAEPVADENIYTEEEIAADEGEEEAAPAEEAAPIEEEPVAESVEETQIEEVADVYDGDLQASEEVAEPVADEDIYTEEEIAAAQEELSPAEEETPVEGEPVAENTEASSSAQIDDDDSIEDEVYEEIVGIEDIDIAEIKPTIADDAAIFTFSDPFSAQETGHLVSEAADATEREDEPARAEHGFRLDDEADKLIVGNIAATDYFMFDQAFGKAEEEEVVSENVPEAAPEANEVQPPVPVETAAIEEEPQQVSRYHDEKMPYSFLWWLDKTRKEHAGVYQPYSAFNPQAAAEGTAPDALQQQYYENIFHITSVEDLDKSTAQNVETEVKHKGDEIIERFIKDEPQIRPTSTLKLDTENKAKRSAEDQYDLVTETLANIYAEQMLYPKAIAIYRKLMLKFPEKSRYFADRIENLTKKTT